MSSRRRPQERESLRPEPREPRRSAAVPTLAAAPTQRSPGPDEKETMAPPRLPVAATRPSGIHPRLPAALEAASARPRVAVLEDHPEVLRALGRRFGHQLELVVIGTLAEAERRSSEPFDAWIVDRCLLDGDGLDFALRLRARCPSLSIVIFSGLEHGTAYARAMSAGIFYADKPGGIAVLAQLAELWAARRPTPTESTGVRLLDLASNRGLSEREVELIQLALEGLSRRRGAARLGITESSYRGSVTRILAKTGFDNMRELVAHLTYRCG